MHKHDVKRGAVVILVFFILIFLAQNVYSFGISAPYFKNETITVNAGKNYEYPITIQNADDIDYIVDISYESTNSIVNLRKSSNIIASDSYDNVFYFDISIPKDALPGDEYILEYRAQPRTNDSLNAGVSIQRHIKILVVNEPVSSLKEKMHIDFDERLNITILGTTILLLIIITLFILWRLANRISSELTSEKVSTYTISEAKNLTDVKILLEKMDDDHFNLPEIKKIFKEKIAGLTSHNLTSQIKNMTRRQAIRAIDEINK